MIMANPVQTSAKAASLPFLFLHSERASNRIGLMANNTDLLLVLCADFRLERLFDVPMISI